MALTPSLTTSLAHDLAVGAWMAPTVHFWAQALSAKGRILTPLLLMTLQQDWHTGRWSTPTHELVSALWPTRERSVFTTMRRDFASGAWSPATSRALEEL